MSSRDFLGTLRVTIPRSQLSVLSEAQETIPLTPYIMKSDDYLDEDAYEF